MVLLDPPFPFPFCTFLRCTYVRFYNLWRFTRECEKQNVSIVLHPWSMPCHQRHPFPSGYQHHNSDLVCNIKSNVMWSVFYGDFFFCCCLPFTSCPNGFHINKKLNKGGRELLVGFWLNVECDESGVTFIHHKLFICLWLGHLFHYIVYAGCF